MTEKQINEQLVEDIARILYMAEEAAGKAQASRLERVKLEQQVERDLNAGKEQDMINKLEDILAASDGAKILYHKLSRYYIKNTATLLKYRVEKAAHQQAAIAKPDEAYSLDPYVNQIADILSHGGSDAATGYRAVELAGGAEQLRSILEHRLNLSDQITVTVFDLTDPRNLYRTKEPYLGHKIWMATQMLPVVLIKLKK